MCCAGESARPCFHSRALLLATLSSTYEKKATSRAAEESVAVSDAPPLSLRPLNLSPTSDAMVSFAYPIYSQMKLLVSKKTSKTVASELKEVCVWDIEYSHDVCCCRDV